MRGGSCDLMPVPKHHNSLGTRRRSRETGRTVGKAVVAWSRVEQTGLPLAVITLLEWLVLPTCELVKPTGLFWGTK